MLQQFQEYASFCQKRIFKSFCNWHFELYGPVTKPVDEKYPVNVSPYSVSKLAANII